MKVLPLGRYACREIAEVPKGNKVDLSLREGRAEGGITQGLQLDRALGRITGGEIWINVARVTAQLGDTVLNVCLYDAQQALHADLLRMTLAAPLAVEPRHVTGGRVF